MPHCPSHEEQNKIADVLAAVPGWTLDHRISGHTVEAYLWKMKDGERLFTMLYAALSDEKEPLFRCVSCAARAALEYDGLPVVVPHVHSFTDA